MSKTEKKKNVWICKVQVDLCAEHEVTVIVKTTKPHIARQLAESECYSKGFFQAKCISCEEMK